MARSFTDPRRLYRSGASDSSREVAEKTTVIDDCLALLEIYAEHGALIPQDAYILAGFRSDMKGNQPRCSDLLNFGCTERTGKKGVTKSGNKADLARITDLGQECRGDPDKLKKLKQIHREKTKAKRVIMESDVTPEKVIASKAEILGREETLQNRYRPAFLDEILGHDEVIAAIKAAIKAGERAFVLTGISGVGKTTMALRFAEEVIGASGDQIIPLDAAKFNGVETMTTLSDTVERHRDHPFLTGGLRVYILDEVHAITKAGWSVLLNALENLPPGWYFFLLTNDLDKVPPEIKSQRCAVFELLPVPTNDTVKILKDVVHCEGWSTPKEIIGLCARESLGSPRRAITHLGACYHCTDRDQAARLIRAAVTKTQGDWGYKLAQALQTPMRSALQRILRDAREAKEHPEGMRRVVCIFYETVGLNAKDDRTWSYAEMVLNNFADVVTDSYQLLLAAMRTLREANNGK
jgi:DNA polymerase III delta prime subunit